MKRPPPFTAMMAILRDAVLSSLCVSYFESFSMNKTKAESAHLNSTPLMTCQALGAGWGGGFWGWVSAGGSLPMLPLLVTCRDRSQGEEGGWNLRTEAITGTSACQDPPRAEHRGGARPCPGVRERPWRRGRRS